MIHLHPIMMKADTRQTMIDTRVVTTAVDAPLHSIPSPTNPSLQEHVNDPGVLAQSAFASQLLSASDPHSLISLHEGSAGTQLPSF